MKQKMTLKDLKALYPKPEPRGKPEPKETPKPSRKPSVGKITPAEFRRRHLGKKRK